MSRHPLHVLAKISLTQRIEIGGTTEVAQAFLPGSPSAAIRIGSPRKRLGLRRRRALPGKRRAASG